ncbi:MAG: fimbrillin family protein [Bacteroidaceae bacterium]|nr:fimbrillin family protein [Bacteroidaceae bacterium]
MKTTRFFMAIAAVMLLIACNNENDFENVYVPDDGEIQLVMLHPGQTRATETSFEENDSIGVYVTESDAELQLAGNEVNNELFTYNGTSWTSQRKVYWNSGLHNVYAYYPYSRGINDTENHSFTVSTDQSTHEGYTGSDFLWASVAGVEGGNEPVAVQFAHKMSNVVVKLEKGENYDGDIPDDVEVYILGTVNKALIDLSTGDACKDHYAATASIRCNKIDNSTYQAIVVPQSITSRRPLVEIISGNVSYLVEGKISYQQGKRHNIVVTLDKNPEKIEIEIGGSLGGWN